MEVTLIDSMGSDLRIVQAAKVSIGRNRQVDWDHYVGDVPGWGVIDSVRLKAADRGVVRYMLENHHGTPFEHNNFTFYIKTNIGIMREAQRHRFASWNELSTRYAMMQRIFDLPALEDMREQVGKPGHYTYQALEEGIAKGMLEAMEKQCNTAFTVYENLVACGLAKEVARGVLPLFLQTEAYMTLNLRSAFNFLGLRLHQTALREIQLLSSQMLALVTQVVPETMELWNEVGRPISEDFHDCMACDYHLDLEAS